MENSEKLYNQDDMKLMRNAEDALIMGENRINELRKYAKLAGLKKIGIAHCVSMMKQAEELKRRFNEDGVEVHTIDCKYGKMKASEFLNDPDIKGTNCNPAGQADYLSKQNTELNIVMGLCVGHDIVFNMKSKAPVTTLVVKDREHKHNPFQEFES